MNFSFFVFFPSSLSFFYTFILMFEVSYLCPLHDIQIFFPVFPQWILERFKIYKFNDRCNLRTNLLFQTSADSQNCTSRVPLLFLALFLSSESRCGARNSTYRISNVIISLYGWGCHIGVTPLPPPPSFSSSERPASYTAGHVDHEKRNTGVS